VGRTDFFSAAMYLRQRHSIANDLYHRGTEAIFNGRAFDPASGLDPVPREPGSRFC